jgi:hypothetical protein
MKFDPDALVYPYVFVGAVARSVPSVLNMTIDTLVKDPGNVTEEEAMKYWAVNSIAFGNLRSRSATDISETAFKLHCGELSRMLPKLDKAVQDDWKTAADLADVAGVKSALMDIEREFSEREIRRTRLQYALFFEGLKRDKPGSVRTALAYRSSLMAHRKSKHFVETGKELGGEDSNAERVATNVVDAKSVPFKRPRYATASQKDQVSVRHALLTQMLQTAGVEPTDDDMERVFVKDGPNAVSSMMNDIHSIIDRKRRKVDDETLPMDHSQ